MSADQEEEHTSSGKNEQQPLTSSFELSSVLPINGNSVHPQKDKCTTNQALDALLNQSLRPTPSDVYGYGPMLLSDIPKNIRENKDRGVVLGIDEAGRGPVLGPMTYGCAFWLDGSDNIPKDFNDSKQLKADKRAQLFKQIQSSDTIGFVLRILHASEISRSMLRKVPYNLNAMSHDAAIDMIRCVLDAGVKVDTCYIDTVGIADMYRKKLERVFVGKGITFIVEKKADDKYAPCSAASIVAKVSRDTIIENWKYTEDYQPKNGNVFGSGYPSDPKCKTWLGSNCNVDVPFGYPDFVRFSWAPSKNALKDHGENSGPMIKWEADEDEEDDSGGKQQSLDSFVVSKKVGGKGKSGNLEELRRKRARLGIYNELGLGKVTKFVEAAY